MYLNETKTKKRQREVSTGTCGSILRRGGPCSNLKRARREPGVVGRCGEV